MWTLQGDYGFGDGWEDLTSEETVAEIRKRCTEYRQNDPYVKRLRIRREPETPES